MSTIKLQEGVDYTVNKRGQLVFTRSYLLRRGVCCHSQCQNCPYPNCACHKPKTKRK